MIFVECCNFPPLFKYFLKYLNNVNLVSLMFSNETVNYNYDFWIFSVSYFASIFPVFNSKFSFLIKKKIK